MKTIVIGTDGSEPAAAALAMAFQLAADTGAGVLCVGVDDSFSKDGIDPAPTAAAESAAGQARERGIQAEFVTRVGPAAEQLLAAADACDADLIVVGSRGRGRLTSAVLGSVAHGLIRHATRPVLVVTATADHAAASVEATSSAVASDG
jgi:nucleotide-binding universal stress UspA family protein